MIKNFLAAISVFSLSVLPVVAKEPGFNFDFGDAPDFPINGYPSLLASNGARHHDVARFNLGVAADLEIDSWQVDSDSPAVGSDDGLDIWNLVVSVKNNDWTDVIYLNALLDINKDGDWEDDLEWIVQNVPLNIPQGTSAIYPLPISPFMFLPWAFNFEYTWLRVTVSETPIENYIGTGEFIFGETEDHVIKPFPGPPPDPKPKWGDNPKSGNGGKGGGGGGGSDGGGNNNGGGRNGGGNGGGRGGVGPGLRGGRPPVPTASIGLRLEDLFEDLSAPIAELSRILDHQVGKKFHEFLNR